MRDAVVRLLLALHPRAWRQRYGDELIDLIAQRPLTAWAALDVVRNAVRQHVAVRPVRARVAGAVLATIPIEIVAATTHLADNVLWPPTTVVRAVVLTLLLVAWVPAATATARTLRGRRRARAGA